MQNYHLLVLAILIGIFPQTTLASGKRTTQVTMKAISSYRILDFNSVTKLILHYVETVNNMHLLMLIKTAFPKALKLMQQVKLHSLANLGIKFSSIKFPNNN